MAVDLDADESLTLDELAVNPNNPFDQMRGGGINRLIHPRVSKAIAEALRRGWASGLSGSGGSARKKSKRATDEVAEKANYLRQKAREARRQAAEEAGESLMRRAARRRTRARTRRSRRSSSRRRRGRASASRRPRGPPARARPEQLADADSDELDSGDDWVLNEQNNIREDHSAVMDVPLALGRAPRESTSRHYRAPRAARRGACSVCGGVGRRRPRRRGHVRDADVDRASDGQRRR